MKFVIEYGEGMENRQLTYIPEEHSFDMTPIVTKVDFELLLNKLTLSVINYKVVQLWGFCGLDASMKTNYSLPKYRRGILKVEHDLKHGHAYGINDKDFPVSIDIKRKWVCVGNPLTKGNAVEFIKNCVVVIDSNNEFVSLWLKPETLPSYIK